MSVNIAKKQKNQSLECWKLIAAIAVIFIHAPFPGTAGTYITSLARFAVPLFFTVSGYFSFGLGCGKIAKRIRHIVKLNVLAIIVHIFWFYLLTLYYGGSSDPLRLRLLTAENLLRWAFLHINPYAYHLWYLTAILVCYLLLWIYVRLFGQQSLRYTPLYRISLLLLIIRFIAADLLRTAGMEIPYYLFRDGWFLGLPMLSLGVFLREHQDRLLSNRTASDRNLFLLFIFGAALCLVQRKFMSESELPLGAVLQVIALILLAARHPRIDGGSKRISRILSTFGFLSAGVYILHTAVIDAYLYILHPYPASYFGAAEPWLRPLIVISITLFLCVILERIIHFLRALFAASFRVLTRS